jgi:predicted phosphodiesterase
MSFQLLSDLHLERAPKFALSKNPDCDYLILAGDIGDPESSEYAELLHSASQQFEHTFVIKGNHECYGRTPRETDDLIATKCRELSRVTYLSDSGIDLPQNMRIVGSTLWSYVTDAQRPAVQCFIADYRYITNWHIDKNNVAHCKSVAYIKSEIARARERNKQLIIVTHHAPIIHGTSNPAHDRSLIKSAYASDLAHLFGPPVFAWCHGHTHHCHKDMVNGTVLISNQRGLPHEDTGFNRYTTI